MTSSVFEHSSHFLIFMPVIFEDDSFRIVDLMLKAVDFISTFLLAYERVIGGFRLRFFSFDVLAVVFD